MSARLVVVTQAQRDISNTEPKAIVREIMAKFDAAPDAAELRERIARALSTDGEHLLLSPDDERVPWLADAVLAIFGDLS